MPAVDTIPLDDFSELLHQMRGHRLALVQQLAAEDQTAQLRAHGGAAMAGCVIAALNQYQQAGELTPQGDPEQLAAYAKLSRAMWRADRAAEEADAEPEPLSFY